MYIQKHIQVKNVLVIKFKANIRKVGNSYVVTVPSTYISNGLLNENKTYSFLIEEVKE